MKITPNKPHSIHLRLTEEQFAYVSKFSQDTGLTYSDYVRMLINYCINLDSPRSLADQEKEIYHENIPDDI